MGHYSTVGGLALGSRGLGGRRLDRRFGVGCIGRTGRFKDHSFDARGVWNENAADRHPELGMGGECNAFGLVHTVRSVVGECLHVDGLAVVSHPA